MQGAAKKRGRSAGGKPPAPKKVRKKAQGSKTAKAKKWDSVSQFIVYDTKCYYQSLGGLIIVLLET